MKSTIKSAILSAFTVLLTFQAQAQVKIGNNPTVRNADSELEIESTSKGLLLPRVALTSTTSFAPLSAHVAGMTVYNTATTGDVAPGYYYNDGTKWVTFWKTTGNAQTDDTKNFLGTTDAQALHFRVNGTPAGLLDYATQSSFPGANVILGYNAAPGITSANNNLSYTNNVIIGYEAGQNQTQSYRNTYVGARAGKATTTAHENVVLGWEAGLALTTGSWNTSLGVYAGKNTTTGAENVGVGFHAGENVTTGSQNVGVGDYAGNGNSTGSNNTFLGFQADASANGLTTATAIGNKAKVGISNALVLGGTGANAVNVGIGTTSPTANLHVVGSTLAAAWTTSSDARLKTNIVGLGQGTLNKVMQLKAVSYDKKESLESADYNKKEMGFIAQDLRKIFPNIVQENGKDKLLSVNYTALIPVLTKAVQELKQENDDLKQEVAQLKAQMEGIASLAAQVKELQALVGNNKAVNATEASVKTGKK